MSLSALSPAARQTLQILSDQWHLSLLLCLEEQPYRFNQLRQNLPQISPRALSSKLKNLQQAGYVMKRCPEDNKNFCEYSLSKKAEELKPVLEAMRGIV